MPTLKGCKQLVKELFLIHFLLPPHTHLNFGAAARGQHSKAFFLLVNYFSKKLLLKKTATNTKNWLRGQDLNL